jgi:hypothetical protein
MSLLRGSLIMLLDDPFETRERVNPLGVATLVVWCLRNGARGRFASGIPRPNV